MSIFDRVVGQKYWTFHGALVRPGGDDGQRPTTYPSIGLSCEVVKHVIETQFPVKFHSWSNDDTQYGSVREYDSFFHHWKALQLKMVEPDKYQKHLNDEGSPHKGKFPEQGPMNTSLKTAFSKLWFVEHGDFLVSNPLLIKDGDIKGGEQLAVTYVIRLIGEPGKEAMIITGRWSDHYLGTGGWC